MYVYKDDLLLLKSVIIIFYNSKYKYLESKWKATEICPVKYLIGAIADIIRGDGYY